MQLRYLVRNLILCLISATFVVGVVGCSSPPKKTMTIEERVRAEQAIGMELSGDFEARLNFKRDTEVTVYLRNLAERLSAATPELELSAVGVLMISNHQEKWRNFSVPGNRIYLSAELLKNMAFENQVAAAISIELGHIIKRSVIKRIRQNLDERAAGLEGPITGEARPGTLNGMEAWVLPAPREARTVEYFGPRGAFTFDETAWFGATEEAVGVMYRAGYDPRGIVSFLELYRDHPARAPLENGLLDKLIEKTRRVIAQRAPLRNPVVRSHEFLAIQKRIKKL